MADTGLQSHERLRGLLTSMGVTNYDEGTLAALAAIAKAEEDAARLSAAHYAIQLGKKVVDADCMRLACGTRRLLQPPLRGTTVDAARTLNARTVAWPLGPAVRVPTASAAEYRVETLLLSASAVGSSSSSASSSSSSSSSSSTYHHQQQQQPTFAGNTLAVLPAGSGFAVELAPLGARPLVVIGSIQPPVTGKGAITEGTAAGSSGSQKKKKVLEAFDE